MEESSLGVCEHCGKDIYSDSDYYELEDVLVHDDCILDYIRQFKREG
jgi:hypothetical protein